MKKLLLAILISILGTVIFAGCGQTSMGSKYVGKWVGLEAAGTDGKMTVLRQLEISPNGNNFIIKSISTVSPKSTPTVETVSASLTQDGNLQVNPSIVLTFAEKDNTLMWNGATYKKETHELLERLKSEQTKGTEEREKAYKKVPVFQ